MKLYILNMYIIYYIMLKIYIIKQDFRYLVMIGTIILLVCYNYKNNVNFYLYEIISYIFYKNIKILNIYFYILNIMLDTN